MLVNLNHDSLVTHFAIQFELHKMTNSLRKFWISENRPADHIAADISNDADWRKV